MKVLINVPLGGTCLEDIELRRNDETFMDGLGAERIPDPNHRRGFYEAIFGRGNRAKAKSLLARSSQSCGVPGIALSCGMVQLLALPKGRINDQRWVFSVIPDVAFGHYHDILGKTQSSQASVDRLRGSSPMDAIRHYDQNIKIAVRAHCPTCSRTEENDASGVYRINNPPDHFIE